MFIGKPKMPWVPNRTFMGQEHSLLCFSEASNFLSAATNNSINSFQIVVFIKGADTVRATGSFISFLCTDESSNSVCVCCGLAEVLIYSTHHLNLVLHGCWARPNSPAEHELVFPIYLRSWLTWERMSFVSSNIITISFCKFNHCNLF